MYTIKPKESVKKTIQKTEVNRKEKRAVQGKRTKNDEAVRVYGEEFFSEV